MRLACAPAASPPPSRRRAAAAVVARPALAPARRPARHLSIATAAADLDAMRASSSSAAARVAGALLAALLLATAPAPALAQTREFSSASVRVVDGDTMAMGDTKVRMFGIDAPESSQTCTGAAGETTPCGASSTKALAAAVAGRPVRCSQKSLDQYGRSVAVCYGGPTGGADLNAGQVAAGQAVAYTRYSKLYVEQETAARAAKRGIWAGPFVEPEQFRRDPSSQPNGAPGAGGQPAPRPPAVPDPAAPSAACAIKGNISSGGKLYHVPGGASYAATKITTNTGERWFCSAAEAEAAGWRAAGGAAAVAGAPAAAASGAGAAARAAAAAAVAVWFLITA
jgi:endonuclease YncB( thermonuclease family)